MKVCNKNERNMQKADRGKQEEIRNAQARRRNPGKGDKWKQKWRNNIDKGKVIEESKSNKNDATIQKGTCEDERRNVWKTKECEERINSKYVTQ